MSRMDDAAQEFADSVTASLAHIPPAMRPAMIGIMLRSYMQIAVEQLGPVFAQELVRTSAEQSGLSLNGPLLCA
jgi:hypothetical protein